MGNLCGCCTLPEGSDGESPVLGRNTRSHSAASAVVPPVGLPRENDIQSRSGIYSIPRATHSSPIVARPVGITPKVPQLPVAVSKKCDTSVKKLKNLTNKRNADSIESNKYYSRINPCASHSSRAVVGLVQGPPRVPQPPVARPLRCDMPVKEFSYLTIDKKNARSSVSSNRNGNLVANNATAPQVRSPDVQRNPLREAKLVHPSSNILFMIHYITDYAGRLNWEGDLVSQLAVRFLNLDSYSDEYDSIERLFNKTNKRCFKVTNIERIQNPFLLAAFLLKKEEMEERIGYQNIKKLFHGTKNDNVLSICTDNLDWRLYGQNTGHTFGQGMSFTPISNYATHYGDDTPYNRVMLLVHVLVGKECVGNEDTEFPPDGFDTTTKPNGHVIVKYEDNEFYPAYKIIYCCTDANELNRRWNNDRHRRCEC